jgi:hypothetical protein
LTAEQLRQRAREYRSMAESASTVQIRDALRRLADRFDDLAEKRARAETEPEPEQM